MKTLAPILLAAAFTVPSLAFAAQPAAMADTSAVPATVPVLVAPDLITIDPIATKTAQNHPEVDRLIERLERQSDDGTLNSHDLLRIRMLRKRLAS